MLHVLARVQNMRDRAVTSIARFETSCNDVLRHLEASCAKLTLAVCMHDSSEEAAIHARQLKMFADMLVFCPSASAALEPLIAALSRAQTAPSSRLLQLHCGDLHIDSMSTLFRSDVSAEHSAFDTRKCTLNRPELKLILRIELRDSTNQLAEWITPADLRLATDAATTVQFETDMHAGLLHFSVPFQPTIQTARLYVLTQCVLTWTIQPGCPDGVTHASPRCGSILKRSSLDLAISPDGTWAALLAETFPVSIYTYKLSDACRVMELEAEPLILLDKCKAATGQIAFIISPRNTILVSDGTRNGLLEFTRTGDTVRCLRLDQDLRIDDFYVYYGICVLRCVAVRGDCLVTADTTHMLVYSYATAALQRKFELPNCSGFRTATPVLAFTVDGRHVLVSNYSTHVMRVDIETGAVDAFEVDCKGTKYRSMAVLNSREVALVMDNCGDVLVFDMCTHTTRRLKTPQCCAVAWHQGKLLTLDEAGEYMRVFE